MRKRARFLAFGLAAATLSIVAACGGGGPSVPACQTGTPTEPLTASPAASLTLKVGSYEGTGSPQCIRDVGFQPVLVIIKGDAGDPAVWRSSSMSGDSTANFSGRVANLEGAVTSLDPDAFSLGKNTAVNAKGVAYQYIAFASHADIKVGSYLGDGIDNRSISGIGFRPDLVWIKTEGGSAAVWNSSEMSGDSSALFDKGFDEEDLDNLIQSLEGDGFQVGSHPAVNVSADDFHYVAFRAVPGSFAVGTYTGDGVDDRSITGLGFQPDYVWVNVDSGSTSMVHRSANQEGDTTMRIVGAGNAADEIQALQADGFQVGTSNVVNTDGDRYRYVAWKSARVAPTP